MKKLVRACTLLGVAAVAVACSSATPSPGVANTQPGTGAVCFEPGNTCYSKDDCCTHACVNNVCALWSPR